METPVIQDAAFHKTFSQLNHALFRLLQDSLFENISLADICKRAQISRAVFYRYFGDKYHLLHFCLENFLEEQKLDCDIFFLRNPQLLQNFFYTLFSCLEEDKELYCKIYYTNKNGLLFEDIRQFLSIVMNEKLLLFQEIGFSLTIAPDVLVNISTRYYLSIVEYFLESDDELNITLLSEYIVSFINNDFFKQA